MKRIVLVEDDEPIKDVFRLIFKREEFDIEYLDNGEPILDHHISPSDLFIIDRQLSGTNGLDLCRFIKTSGKFKNIPVIMVSASPDIAGLADSAGADDSLQKPFTLKSLRQKVAAYV